MMKTVLFFAALLILSGHDFSFAQQGCCAELPRKLTGSHSMSAKEGTTTFPLLFEENHILLPVEILGETFRLILDTGMPHDGAILFSNPRVRRLEFENAQRVLVGGGGSDEPSEGLLAREVLLKLPGLELKDQTVTVMNVDSTLGGDLQADGILGLAIFGRFAVSIDYEAMKLTLTEPEQFRYSGPGREVPFSLEDTGIPEMECRVETDRGTTVPVRLTVDTGAGHALSLHAGSCEGLSLPERMIACPIVLPFHRLRDRII